MLDPIGFPVSAADAFGADAYPPAPIEEISSVLLPIALQEDRRLHDDLDMIRLAIRQSCRNDALRTQAKVFRLLADMCLQLGGCEEVVARILNARFSCVQMFKRLEQGSKCGSARRLALISLDLLEAAIDEAGAAKSPFRFQARNPRPRARHDDRP